MANSSTRTEILHAPVKGSLFIMAGVTIFSIQDVIIRYISGDYPLHEILFIRSMFALLPTLLIVHLDTGIASLKTGNFSGHLVRSLFLLLAYTCFYLSIVAMPLADAVALFFISPIMVTGLSILLLHERVTFTRWITLFTGFLGVVIILRPGDIIDPAAFLSIIAALAYAGSALATRRLGETESGSVMAFFITLLFMVFAGVMGLLLGGGRFSVSSHVSLSFLTRAWIVPTRFDLMLIAICGFNAALGIFCLSQGYRVARASAVASFEYVAMVPAVIWGYLFWNEIPGIHTITGIILIIGSGIYMLRRDARPVKI
jgi:S-adenosylmethionine uptake transporter